MCLQLGSRGLAADDVGQNRQPASQVVPVQHMGGVWQNCELQVAQSTVTVGENVQPAIGGAQSGNGVLYPCA